MPDYRAVTNVNQGTFNNPRQKTWVTMQNVDGWRIKLTTGDLNEATETARQILNAGGEYASINRIMVAELVPIDTVMTPRV